MLEQDESITCALLGDPGSGKSALLSKFAGELSARDDLMVLAIKADLISRSVTTESDLQADLGLPEPPSVMLRKLGTHRAERSRDPGNASNRFCLD
ncbi:MAG: hypothetical protein RET84_02615 [Pseudomonadota bacterium]|nr:hypothetical protein [Pseudomonadota bacterium]